jgi:heat shock protein HslJ
MHNLQNVPFGQTVWVAIEVPPDPEVPTATVTPQATATPPVDPTAVPPTATVMPPEPTPTEKPGSDLLDQTWVVAGYLLKIDDEELTLPIPGTRIEINFEEDDTYQGSTGCNTYSGRYMTDGKNITFIPGQITKINCDEPEGIMDQEAHYIGLLDEVEEYRLNQDNQLELIVYITNENNQREEKILLVFDGL